MVSAQNKHVDIKYLSGENLAIYVNGEQVSVIKDFEIVSGEKSFEIGLEGSESGVLIIGKISYTKYNRQKLFAIPLAQTTKKWSRTTVLISISHSQY